MLRTSSRSRRLNFRPVAESAGEEIDVDLWAAPPTTSTRKILVIATLLFLSEVICYADRVAISVAVVMMKKELGYSESVVGSILSAFFFGYACTQIPGEFVSSRGVRC